MRKPRLKLDQPSASYHVSTRIIQKEFLLTDQFKTDVVDVWIKRYTEVFYVDLLSEVTMTDHYHLLVRIYKPEFDIGDLERRFNLLQSYSVRKVKWAPELAEGFYNRITDISGLMQAFNWRISWIYNRLNEGSGHLWSERFFSRILEGSVQEQITDNYIQTNPVRAGMVKNPSDYQWSTAGKVKKSLEEGEPIKVPPLALLAGVKDPVDRALVYVSFHDFSARRFYDPLAALELPPPEVIALALTQENWEQTAEELRSRGPVQWRKAGYGSPAFEARLQEQRDGPPRPGSGQNGQ